MEKPKGIETIEFPEPVPASDIRSAVMAIISNSKMWPLVRRNRHRFRIGRSGHNFAYHLIVMPIVGRWFSEGESYSFVRVEKFEWPGRSQRIRFHHELLHDYYVRQFAEQLASKFGGQLIPSTERW